MLYLGLEQPQLFFANPGPELAAVVIALLGNVESLLAQLTDS
jgi:hypothetical protein